MISGEMYNSNMVAACCEEPHLKTLREEIERQEKAVQGCLEFANQIGSFLFNMTVMPKFDEPSCLMDHLVRNGDYIAELGHQLSDIARTLGC